jgi:hypothetical protein
VAVKMVCAWRVIALVALSLVIGSAPVRAQVPRDFKGVSIGDKLSRDQFMARFGIKNFKIDPPEPDLGNRSFAEELEKYGITGMSERDDDLIGPYCRGDYCRIPTGVSIGDDHIAVKNFGAFRDGVVFDLEVAFNFFWNDIWDIMITKYGPDWDIEKDTIAVTDYGSKKYDQLERVIATRKFGGVNPQTKDTCSISATNIDIIFRHHDTLGTLHAILELKRKPKDF